MSNLPRVPYPSRSRRAAEPGPSPERIDADLQFNMPAEPELDLRHGPDEVQAPVDREAIVRRMLDSPIPHRTLCELAIDRLGVNALSDEALRRIAAVLDVLDNNHEVTTT